MGRNERSAGIIAFHGDAPENRSYLLLDYGRHWDFPKGHVTAGEDDLAAALRELKEETGIEEVEIVPGFSHEIAYFFRDRRKQLIRKAVVFFLGRTDQTQITLSHEHVGYAFEPFAQAVKRVTYPTAKQVLRLAEAHLCGQRAQP